MENAGYASFRNKTMKFWRETMIGLLLIILFSTVLKCKNETKIKNANYKAFTDSVTCFKNALGTITASKNALHYTNAELKQMLLKNNDSLKKLSKEFTKLHTIITFKNNASLPPIELKFQTDTTRLPSGSSVCESYYSGILKDKWFGFNYKITSDSLKLTNFIVPNHTIALTGVKRKWFFGKTVVTTDITHSNPYIRTENITVAEVIIPEPWYKKWYLWLAAGIAGGLLIK